jgi:MFS family permease
MVGEQVVLGWLALELTDSPLMVGVALGLRMLPLLLFGVPAGVIADQVDRVRLIEVTGAALAGTTGTLALLALTGRLTIEPLLVFAFLGGCARALHQTARQGFAHDVARSGRLVETIALVGFSSRVGGLAGSLAVGALLARFGPGAAYLAVAAGYLGCAAAVLPAPPRPRQEAEHAGSVLAGVVGFLAMVRRDPTLLSLMALTAAAEMFGFSHQAVLPSLARDVLHVGPGGLGVLTGARQAGGVLGVAVVSRLGAARGQGVAFLAVLIGFGATLLMLGLAPTFMTVVLILLAVNALGATTDVLAQTLIQLAVPSGQRGRAGGAWVVAIGMAPLGQFQVGALASALGVGAALGVNGLALIVIACGAAALVPRLRRL